MEYISKNKYDYFDEPIYHDIKLILDECIMNRHRKYIPTLLLISEIIIISFQTESQSPLIGQFY